MKEFFFICSYVSSTDMDKYSSTPSAISYCDYLTHKICNIDNSRLKILSTANSKSNIQSNKKNIFDGYTINYFFSFPQKWGSLFVRINQIIIIIQIVLYLLCNSKRSSTIIIYHDYALSYFLNTIRLLVKGKFVFVVAEIFNAVYDRGAEAIKSECRRLRNADGYIFINDILPTIFDVKVPFCVCHGNYNYKERSKCIHKDSKNHVLYAGKISKGIINDAFKALEVAEYLPQNYITHIAGYGTSSDINQLLKEIDIINNRAGFVKVVYEGNLMGEEYENLLSRCNIGLCTRTISDEMSKYCFPSKTIIYLTHGIVPICPKVEIFTRSEINDCIMYVDNCAIAESIAERIKNMNTNVLGNPKDMINTLDFNFFSQLKQIL